MKTKIEIIQRLLDEQKITAVEAMTLMQTEKEYVYIQQPYPIYDLRYPYNPFPYQPYYTTSELTISN